MPYILKKINYNNLNNCNNNLIYIISFIIISLYIIKIYFINYEKFETIDNKIKTNDSDIKHKKRNIHKNYTCSKNCCSTQWKVPIKQDENSNISLEDVETKYKTSNLTCNNGIINTGCICIPNNTNDINIKPLEDTENVFKLIDDKKINNNLNNSNINIIEEIDAYNESNINKYSLL